MKSIVFPVLLQPGVQTTIVAEAVDIMGNAVVDTIEIWTNEGFVFSPQIAAQNFASSTLSYSKTFTDTSISYSCKAVTNGFEFFSGWKSVFALPHSSIRANPIQMTGSAADVMDFVFIPDEDSYTSLSDPNFLSDVARAIDIFFDEPTYLIALRGWT